MSHTEITFRSHDGTHLRGTLVTPAQPVDQLTAVIRETLTWVTRH